MKQQLQRLMTVLAVLTVLTAWLATPYSVMAAAPSDLWIIGSNLKTTNDNFEFWNVDHKCPATSKEGGVFHFNVTFQSAETSQKWFRFVDSDGNQWKAEGESAGQVWFNMEYTIVRETGDAATWLEYSDGTQFSITVDFSGRTPRMAYNPGHNNFPLLTTEGGTVPEKLYLKGHVNNMTWNDSGVEPTRIENGNIFIFDVDMTGDQNWDSGSLSTFYFVDGEGETYV